MVAQTAKAEEKGDMPDDIRSQPSIDHADVTALNFVTVIPALGLQAAFQTGPAVPHHGDPRPGGC